MFTFASKLSVVLLSYCTTLITFPFFIVFLSFFFIFKQFVIIYLKIKFREGFAGMIDSPDTYWLVGEAHHNVSDIILILNVDTELDTVQDIRKILKNKLLACAQEIPKVSSTVHSCCGFGYLFRKDLDFDQCITSIKVTKDNENYSKTLEDIFVECINDKLPYDNTLLWQVVILTGPTEWKLRQRLKENQVPVLIRINHIVGDGLSIIKIFSGMYFEENIDFTKNIQKIMNTMFKKRNLFLTIVENIHVSLMTLGFLTLERFKRQDSRVTYLNTYLDGGKKRFFTNVDTNNYTLECIKRIKKAVTDTAFAEVVLTAISASVERYFTENTPKIPDVAITVIPVMMNISEVKSKKQELKNSFGYFVIQLPILFKSASLLDRLREIKKKTRVMVNAPDLKIRYIFFNYILGLIPVNLVKHLMNLRSIGMCFSNLPGFPRAHCFNGQEIENVFFFPPTTKRGICISLITYDNRIHIGISVDDNIMTNSEHCQRIANDIFQNIGVLDKEVEMEMLSKRVINI